MLQVEDAVILMAGAGSRLQGAGGGIPKPLVRIGGQPVISRAFSSLQNAGVRRLHAVVGSAADLLVQGLTTLVPAGLSLNIITNHEWQKQNGVSVLAARAHVPKAFFLLMGDHLFDEASLLRLKAESEAGYVNLAVDRKLDSIFDMDDAMKVRTEDGLVRRIGKQLADFDAVDTGLFICDPELFDFLEAVRQDGDCSLADGVRGMAEAGKVRAIDIGDGWWQDIDTPEMLRHAEERLTGASQRAASQR